MNKELSKKVNHFEKFILFALQAEEWQPEWLIEEILNQTKHLKILFKLCMEQNQPKLGTGLCPVSWKIFSLRDRV